MSACIWKDAFKLRFFFSFNYTDYHLMKGLGGNMMKLSFTIEQIKKTIAG